jgi:hypothetical protein
MGKTKTATDYANEIKELYLIKSRTAEQDKQLTRKVSSFVKLLDITIYQAQNEQLGWTSEELEVKVSPMLLKSDIQIAQVADYQATYSFLGHSGWIGLLVERKGGKKGVEDLYGSLMVAENCERFYREINRFKNDNRFDQLVLIAECTFEQFLLYSPPFIGSEPNVRHVGASVEARRAKIASLQARGVSVYFCGTRHNAIQFYKSLIRQWCLKHYVGILKLDKLEYHDKMVLLQRKAELEESLKACNHSLEILGVVV